MGLARIPIITSSQKGQEILSYRCIRFKIFAHIYLPRIPGEQEEKEEHQKKSEKNTKPLAWTPPEDI